MQTPFPFFESFRRSVALGSYPRTPGLGFRVLRVWGVEGYRDISIYAYTNVDIHIYIYIYIYIWFK